MKMNRSQLIQILSDLGEFTDFCTRHRIKASSGLKINLRELVINSLKPEFHEPDAKVTSIYESILFDKITKQALQNDVVHEFYYFPVIN